MTRADSHPAPSSGKRAVVLSAAAMVAVAALAFAGARTLLSSGPGQQAPSSAASSAANTAAPLADAAPACGQLAGVDLACLDNGAGKAASASEAGVTVVNVWAWWCGPCREELPLMGEVARKHPEWNVVGVHADKDAQRGEALLKELGVDMFSYQDFDNSFAGRLALPNVIPVTVVMKDGEVTGSIIKAMHSVEEIEREVEALS